MRAQIECKTCGKTFEAYTYSYQPRKYCSIFCRNNDPDFQRRVRGQGFKKGHVPWHKGKHHSIKTKKIMSERAKERFSNPRNHPMYGKPGIHGFEGKHFSNEAIDKMRKARVQRRFPHKETSIELLLQEELNQRGINYAKHLPVLGICQPDILFPDKQIAVFCDGVYWHSLPKVVNRDNRQNQILHENDWRVLRFSGDDIRADASCCVNKIERLIE